MSQRNSAQAHPITRSRGRLRKHISNENTNEDKDLPYFTPHIAWMGSFKVREDSEEMKLIAYCSKRIPLKLRNVIENFPDNLELNLYPRLNSWPKKFDLKNPAFEDIGFYLFPQSNNQRTNYINLLKKLDSKNLALKMMFGGSTFLLVHSSQALESEFRKINGEHFLWGMIWKQKKKNHHKKRKLIREVHTYSVKKEICLDFPDIPPGFSANDKLIKRTGGVPEERTVTDDITLKQKREPISNSLYDLSPVVSFSPVFLDSPVVTVPSRSSSLHEESSRRTEEREDSSSFSLPPTGQMETPVPPVVLSSAVIINSPVVTVPSRSSSLQEEPSRTEEREDSSSFSLPPTVEMETPVPPVPHVELETPVDPVPNQGTSFAEITPQSSRASSMINQNTDSILGPAPTNWRSPFTPVPHVQPETPVTPVPNHDSFAEVTPQSASIMINQNMNSILGPVPTDWRSPFMSRSCSSYPSQDYNSLINSDHPYNLLRHPIGLRNGHLQYSTPPYKKGNDVISYQKGNNVISRHNYRRSLSLSPVRHDRNSPVSRWNLRQSRSRSPVKLQSSERSTNEDNSKDSISKGKMVNSTHEEQDPSPTVNSVTPPRNPNSNSENTTQAQTPSSSIILPFERRSPVWKTLEDLPLFNRIPQKPHFMNLESLKEMHEGVALGLVANYAILADSIHNLSPNDEVAVYEEKITCLDSLETNGFDVDPLRTRLHALLDLKKEINERELRVAEKERELAKKDEDNTHVLDDVDKINADVAKTERKISELREEETRLTVMEKWCFEKSLENGDRILRLREEIVGINRDEEVAREKFVGINMAALGK